MLEEFAASLAISRTAIGHLLGRLSTAPMAASLEDPSEATFVCTCGLSVWLQVSSLRDDRSGTSPTMCAAPSRPAQVATDSPPPSPGQGQPQVTPSRLALTTPSEADAPTEDEVGFPPGFGPAEPTTDADLLSMPPRDGHPIEDSDNSVAHRLKSFTKGVLKNVDTPLIRQPPKQPSPARPVLPLLSKSGNTERVREESLRTAL